MAVVIAERFGYDRNMDAEPSMALMGAMIGAPARAAMLALLFDGRALTATELTLAANVSPATASEHLAKLTAAGLVTCEKHGRHRYYRIASSEVADALEPLALLGSARPTPIRAPTLADRAFREARLCYDHFAGTLGVRTTAAMVERNFIVPRDRDYDLTGHGEAFCSEIGIDVERVRSKRRMFARQCLDWSERVPHLAGALGAAIANHAFEANWIERTNRRREIRVTETGRAELAKHFGFVPSQL
jgi:DNA-binding transcriptional ArsR family regulator